MLFLGAAGHLGVWDQFCLCVVFVGAGVLSGRLLPGVHPLQHETGVCFVGLCSWSDIATDAIDGVEKDFVRDAALIRCS